MRFPQVVVTSSRLYAAGYRQLGLTINIPPCDDHLAVQIVTNAKHEVRRPHPRNVDQSSSQGPPPPRTERIVPSWRTATGLGVRSTPDSGWLPLRTYGAREWLTVGIEERNPVDCPNTRPQSSLPGHGPATEQTVENSPGPWSLPSPGHQMGPGRGEDPHLVRATGRGTTMRPSGNPEGAADQCGDRYGSSPSTAPIVTVGSGPIRHPRREPSAGRAFSVIRMPALSRISEVGRSARWVRLGPIQILLAGGRGQGGDGREDANLHVSVTKSKLDMTKCNSWLTSLRLSAPAVLKNPLYRSSGHTCTYST